MNPDTSEFAIVDSASALIGSLEQGQAASSARIPSRPWTRLSEQVSSLEGERMLADAIARGLPSALSIRLPGTVGRGSHDNFLSHALERILAGEAVTACHKDALFNNIVYVGDLADFLAEWIASPRPGYAVTNIAACDPIRIGDLFSLLFAHAGKPERITFSEDGKAPFQISLEHVIRLGYRPATVRDSVAAFVRDCLSDGGRAD